MAVAFDTTGSNSTTSTGAASLTVTHTVSASATLLVVGVSLDNLSAAPQASWVTVKANGTSMTQAASSPVNNGNGSGLWIFTLASPPTGSVSIVITNAGGSNTNNIDALIGDSASFTGAGSIGTPVVITSGSGATATVTVTGVASTSMVAAWLSAGDNISAPSTGTSRVITNVKGSGGNTDGNQAMATNTGTGSVSVVWGSLGSGDTHAAWGVEVKASGGTAHTATASLTVTPTLTPVRVHASVRGPALTVTPALAVVRVHASVRGPHLTVTPMLSVTRAHASVRGPVLALAPQFSNTISHVRANPPPGGADDMLEILFLIGRGAGL